MEGDAVVTAIDAAFGDVVTEGARVVEVSGRPVFIMQGDVPVYRTLRPGMQGADAALLQAALARLGFAPDADGVFGEATKTAVSEFYTAAGYAALPNSPAAAADIAAAVRATSDAQTAVDSAQLALDEANDGLPASTVASAEGAFNHAVRARDLALAQRESDLVVAQQELDTAIVAYDRLHAGPEASPDDLNVEASVVAQANCESGDGRLDHR